MKYFLLFIFAFSSIAQSALERKLPADKLILGTNAAGDKSIEWKGKPNKLRVSDSSNKLEFTNDGSVWKRIGSGSGTGGSGGINLLSNSSFEEGLGNWSNSGGTLTQETYTNPIEGDSKYARFVATAAGQYFEQVVSVFPDKISGGCMADFKYKEGDNSFIYKIVETGEEGALSDSVEWRKAQTLVFDCPSSGTSVTLRIESIGAGTVEVDEVYNGSNKGLIAGTYSNSIKLEGNGSDVVGAGVATPFSGSGIGWNGSQYTIQRNGSVIQLFGAAYFTGSLSRRYSLYRNGVEHKALNQTSNNSFFPLRYISEKGEFSKGDTISIRLTTGSGTLDNNPTNHYLVINEFSSDTSEAYSTEQAEFFIDASIGGANVVASGLSEAEVINGSLDMVLHKGGAKIPCSGTNPSTGLTCSSGSEGVGIVFNAPRSGFYEVCINGAISGNSGAASYRLVHTENNSQTVLEKGRNLIYANTHIFSFRSCDQFKFSSTGEKTIRLFGDHNSGNVTFYFDRDAGQYERSANITVRMVDHYVSTPRFLNMVDTKESSGLRIQACKIINTGTVTGDASQCNSWISSYQLMSGGKPRLNFLTGTFSSPPICVSGNAIGGPAIGQQLESTINYVQIDTYNSLGSLVDNGLNIICFGGR